MVLVLRRLAEAFTRLLWMTRLTANPVGAISTIIRISRDSTAAQTLKTREGLVSFRGVDEQAIKEVLVNREYEFLDTVVREIDNPRILDVGAHIGTFALWALAANPSAHIISIEADPRTFELASKNVAEQLARGRSWTIVHAAAGARDGECVYLTDTGPSMSHRIAADGSVPVATVSLAALLFRATEGKTNLDLMKVDIEGSEQAFLCTNPALLHRIETLVVELHPDICDTGHVRSILNLEFDRVIEIVGRKSSKPLLYCYRSTGPSGSRIQT